MQSVQTRRRLLATLSCATAASAFVGARISAQEAPPETTTIRLAKVPGICIAPQYIAEGSSLTPADKSRSISLRPLSALFEDDSCDGAS